MLGIQTRRRRIEGADKSTGQVFDLVKQLCIVAQLALYVMVEVEKVICPHNSPLNIKGEAIDIDHRIMKQLYTTLFPLNGTLVVERPVVWHAKKTHSEI